MKKIVTSLFALVASFIMMPAMHAEIQKTEGDSVDLQALIDSFEFSADDYAWGSNPGMVGDSTIYADFYNTYSDALMLLADESATYEQEAELYDKLVAAKAKVDSAIVPVSDGVYYFETAFTAFTDTMAWFAPYSGKYIGWKKLQPKIIYMWQVTKLADGNYSIQNLGTGTYANHTDVIDGAETNLYATSTLETEQQFDNIKPNGQFNIHCVGAEWTYNIQHHNSGAATSGPVGNWSDKSIGGEGSWKVIKVSDEELAAAQATKYTDLLTEYVSAFVDDYAVGSDPGYYPKDKYDALIAEYETAKALVEDTVNVITEEAAKTEYEKFYAALTDLNESVIPITDGYYAISLVSYDNLHKGSSGLAARQDGSEAWIHASNWTEADPAFIWEIKNLGNDRYSVQNKQNGYYFNSTDLIAVGAHINLSSAQTTPQLFIMGSNGGFRISNSVVHESSMYYCMESTGIYISTGSSTFYLHKYTDNEVDSIVAAYPQKLRTDSMANLIASATYYTSIDSVWTMDLTSPIVTDKSQLYINNLSSEQTDLGNLIDGDFNTFCISAWNDASVTNEDNYHSIRVDAGEGSVLPTHFGMHWHTRGSTWANMYRPIDVNFYVSDDATTWVLLGELANPEAGFPVTAEEPEYTSSTPITTQRGYRYFKMEVLKTNTGSIGKYGYPYFTFAEFNVYPMTGEANPALSDEEVKTALEELRTAIATAAPHVEANDASSADIAALQEAYNNFLLVWKDTSDLYKMYTTAINYVPKIVVGEDMFTFPEDKVEAFEQALSDVEDNRPFTEISQRRVAELDTALTRAYNDLRNSMIGPDSTTWYSIVSTDKYTTQGGSTRDGQITWIGGITSVDGFACGGDPETYMLNNPRRAWRFQYAGKPGVYNMINCGSGWRENQGPVLLEPLGDGQFAIYTGTNLDSPYYIQANGGVGVPYGNVQPKKDSVGAWKIYGPAPEELTYTMNLYQGRVMGLVLPFDTYELPTGINDEPVSVYNVCGLETADGEDGTVITGVKLTEYDNDTIAAGTPFVIVVEPDDTYNEDSLVTVDFKTMVNGHTTCTSTSVNGLAGTFSLVSLATKVLYFSKDSAYIEESGFQVNPQRCYLNPFAVVEDEEASCDRIVPVSGIMEFNTGIKSNVVKTNSVVNVYTIDGVLLRKNVKRADALNGLEKGVYIVGKEKVLVK